MRIAYLECFSGISGDMMLGALLHAGVTEDLLRQTVAALDVGAELRIKRVDRSGKVKPDFGCPCVRLVEMTVENFPADNLPPDLAKIPAVKPGSK